MEEIILVQAHNEGFAFAVTESSLEHIYIPIYAREGLTDLEPGKKYKAILVPNHAIEQRERTPWVCVKLLEADTDPAKPLPKAKPVETDVATRDEAVFKAIANADYLTSAELADATGLDVTTATNSAWRLHEAGRVARADVHAKGGQKRASFALWALNARKFTD